ncbi:MAG: hypothetical protein IJN54_06220 [Lachnospiraceae bacterium]|nr:hypothetical protein [Lachnospiraceae bacterium]
MMEERFFDYENYIQKRLKEIDDLDERKYAKELLLSSLGEVFAWTEEKYKALEQRIKDELDNPWKNFNVYMTVIERENYDPINNFWYPVCEEDLKNNEKGQEYETIYLKTDNAGCREFLSQGTIVGIDEKTGQNISFQIRKSMRYEERMKTLYGVFVSNHISWQTVHMGHLERFFDLIPMEEISTDSKITFQWGSWEKYVGQNQIPLWNIQKIMVQSQEFRRPCLDEVIYEHIYYLGNERTEEDGYLVEVDENIISIRYEKNKVLLKTEKESLENVFIYRLHQGNRGNSYGYQYPVLSNDRKDNLAVRYLQQTGNFIQTPMELHRKIEELSGNYHITLLEYEITDHIEGNPIEGDMNGYIGTQVFEKDKRNILLFKFRKEEMAKEDYWYEAQIRYILSQLQMEFLEYRCIGVMV